MQIYRIKTIDRIAPEGVALLDDRFAVSPGEEDPHGIVVRSSRVDTDAYPSLLAVARAGAGVNTITVDKATARGICVFNTPGANANAVAELVFTMLGVGARNIHRALDFCRGLAGLSDAEIAREVEARKGGLRGFELAGKTIGVLGLGKIGVRVANAGALRRMRVIGFDPYPALGNIHLLSSEVVLARSLGEMVEQADILTLHLPLSDKTRGLVNGELLGRMRPGAVLVNYARGPVVDEEAVLASLESGRLSLFLTDFPTRAIVGHPQVIVSPHLGASTEESEESCARMAVQELKGFLLHGAITHSVNFPTAESIPAASVHSRLIMINRDIPDMIGFASHAIGAHGINIASYLNASNGTVGYNLIDLETALPKPVLRQIEAHPGVIRTRVISYQA
ncbi:MAG: 3-phosphoglycerate dehydrogenase family protein [Desulfobacteraceae bacterium]|nr:3-phosphoglycerate dehydrogenase family protein [Desulfobacteraceae bacterium]